MSARSKDIAGLRFGKLVAMRIVAHTDRRIAIWMCQCDCGFRTAVRGDMLRGAHTKSCGCSRGERQITHGHSIGQVTSPTYNSWRAMRQRCEDQNSKTFAAYGARGIVVCRRWRTFANFLADMGPRPLGTTLDRFPDKEGNYEPGNCRWATAMQQTANRRAYVWLPPRAQA